MRKAKKLMCFNWLSCRDIFDPTWALFGIPVVNIRFAVLYCSWTWLL
uniref:Uncharacterized protein n=1 Tax=Arundo donax TaxID=35708 RepID=A0A0A8Z598_ARUDO